MIRKKIPKSAWSHISDNRHCILYSSLDLKMPQHATPIEIDRPLTVDEQELIHWLLENGNDEAAPFLAQLSDTGVVAHCPCGCASIDLAVGGRRGAMKGGMHVISDFRWRSPEGFLFGAFVFTCDGLLAALIFGQSMAKARQAVCRCHISYVLMAKRSNITLVLTAQRHAPLGSRSANAAPVAQRGLYASL
jgi:hypothetical protein